MNLDGLKAAAEKVKDSLPLYCVDGERYAYLEYEDGGEAAVLGGPDAKPLAHYLALAANALPALLPVVLDLRAERDALAAENALLREALRNDMELWALAIDALVECEPWKRVSFWAVHDPVGRISEALASPSPRVVHYEAGMALAERVSEEAPDMEPRTKGMCPVCFRLIPGEAHTPACELAAFRAFQAACGKGVQ